MSRLYTTKEKVQNYLLINVDSSFDTQMESWIKGVSLLIENTTQRRFMVELDGDDEPIEETRYYDGDGSPEMIIDDAMTITELQIGDENGANFSTVTDHIKYPRTAPHRKIILRTGFNFGIQNIKVTGTFASFQTTPEDIEFVATVLVSGILNTTLKKIGKKSERIGNYSVTYGDDGQVADFDRAKQILESHTKLSI